MAIDTKLIDELLVNYKKPEQIVGENGLLKELTKAILERVMHAEMADHLGYQKHDPAGYNTGNSRNGTSRKIPKGDFGEIDLEAPRDRNGSFEPKMVPKGQTRFTGFDDKILSLYARGMTTRDIEGHLKEIYGVEVSPTLISNVTDAVMQEVVTWQNRPLQALYPIVYLDALYVKIRENGQVQNRAVYVAIGLNLEGCKKVLGLWVSGSEGAKFWLQVLTDLKNRGVEDIFVVCVDGLKGLLRNATIRFSPLREGDNFTTAECEDGGCQRLHVSVPFATAKWDGTHPTISQIWRRNWERVIPFFAYPAEIRKVMYTTNAVESLNMSLRKVIKTRGSFPNQEAALKLLYLGLQNVARNWNAVQSWREALNRFQILFPERMPALERL